MHMNRRAWELSRKITQGENGKAATGVLPPAVTELCAEVATAFQVRTNAKDWDQVQITRLVGTPNPPMLLRAFGLPDHQGGLPAGPYLHPHGGGHPAQRAWKHSRALRSHLQLTRH